jgi:2-hydroxychromene-2-carboxylate isomerase
MSVVFWFDFASTYSYLSAMRIEGEAAARGVTVTWQPFLLGPIFAAQGWTTSPFNLFPAKGRNMWRDMERRCSALGLPLLRPDPFPQNSLRAARIGLAAIDHDRAAGIAFCQAVFRLAFAEGQDIAEPDTLAIALTRVGLPAALAGAADQPEIKLELRARGDKASALGIYGAPSFIVGDELFWGDDRLEDALDWARRPVKGQTI